MWACQYTATVSTWLVAYIKCNCLTRLWHTTVIWVYLSQPEIDWCFTNKRIITLYTVNIRRNAAYLHEKISECQLLPWPATHHSGWPIVVNRKWQCTCPSSPHNQQVLTLSLFGRCLLPDWMLCHCWGLHWSLIPVVSSSSSLFVIAFIRISSLCESPYMLRWRLLLMNNIVISYLFKCWFKVQCIFNACCIRYGLLQCWWLPFN